MSIYLTENRRRVEQHFEHQFCFVQPLRRSQNMKHCTPRLCVCTYVPTYLPTYYAICAYFNATCISKEYVNG